MLVTPKLRLVRQLGAGGMGAVWLADHLALNTQVVVKFVSDKLVWSPEAVARFSREAGAASQVKSPHVVQMLDHGVTDQGIPYIVMELLEGHDLADHLTPAGLPPREVVPIITQLCRALSRAHERGIVHRDIKPSNIFLCEMGGGELFVKLLDFGVAKHDAGTKPGEETRTGALIGSPFYMSPEQLMGEKGVDFRSDLWSLGVLTFEALTGQRPFGGETVGALTMQVHAPKLPRPTQKNPALPPAIDAWFEKACARDPAERFSGAKELAATLALALDQEAPRGIALERSAPRVDPMGLADTAEAPSTGERFPSRSGSGSRSGNRSQDAAVSAPPQIAATGAGLTTTGGGRRDATWRPMLVVALVAAGLSIAGTRFLGRGSAAPPSASATPSSATSDQHTPSAVVTTPATATQDVDAGVHAPAPLLPTPPSPGPLKAPAPAPVGRPHGAPAVGAGPHTTPAASASPTRPQGSDDDIR
jgi:serine/threonine-protein kinase